MNGDDQQLGAFLSELNAEIGWEWKWEKQNRFLLFGSNLVTWSARILVLGLSTYAATNYQKTHLGFHRSFCWWLSFLLQM